MNDSVSATLAERAREPKGLGTTTVVSLAAHVLAIAAVVLMPAQWRAGAAPRERDVMTISLGGAPGPRSGGMTSMGGRPVQQVAPPEPKPRPEPVQAPAVKPPEMIVPTRTPARKPPEKVDTAARATLPDPVGRTPTKGAEIRPGNAIAQTGGGGIGFGLSTGGGGTGGEINLGDFCCPDYLQTLLQIIQRNWNSRQQIAGLSAVRFTIRRDGSLEDVSVVRPSGFAVLDLTAQRAVATSKLPPLPSAYPNQQLTITLSFEYQR
jgi:TonB family protein